MSHPDLTPVASPPRTDTNWKKKAALGSVLVVVLTGLGVLLFFTLSGASLFFLDVDEAVSRRDNLGEKRFRVQGITVPGSINKQADVFVEATGERVTATAFQIAFNGEAIFVIHRGNLANIFTDCLPVILEGRWTKSSQNLDVVGRQEYYFASSEMLVKHDNNYKPLEEVDESYSSDNPDRIRRASTSSSQDPLTPCPQI